MRRAAGLLAFLLLAACNGAERPAFQGYVEGEFIQVAPEIGGRIVELPVRRGAQVKPGDTLLRIDDSEAREDVARAAADLARSQAQLANLQEGERPAEVAVIEAQIAEAEASLDMARKDFGRQQILFERRVVSEARLEQARERVTVAEARVLEAERRREVATLPARTPEIEAAERSVAVAQASLNQARVRLGDYVVQATAEGRIEDVYYEQGEVAAAGGPVLSLLPADRRKVIFYLPEPARPGLAVGAKVAVSCDGCSAGLAAEVSFLASEAEYTPPVIFSRDTRDKLVFRAEAWLTGAAAALPLGQPVDVALLPQAP